MYYKNVSNQKEKVMLYIIWKMYKNGNITEKNGKNQYHDFYHKLAKNHKCKCAKITKNDLL